MRRLLHICWLLVPVSATAEVSFDISAANGVAKIVAFADQCGYSVDDEGMSRHLNETGLATSAALGYITSIAQSSKMSGEKASDAECSIVRSTGRKIGLIK